jgi:quercetin dioxygenase-like cupin family protein
MPETLNLTPSETVTVRSHTPDALEVEGRYGPEGKPPPKHFHPDQDEHFEVLEGSLITRVDGVERTLATGDTIDIPRGAVHQMWNPGAEPARVVWTTRTAGRTLEWFETLGALQREGRVAGNGLPGPLAFAAYLTEYRDVIRLAAGPATPLVGGLLAALSPLGRMRGYRAESRSVAG